MELLKHTGERRNLLLSVLALILVLALVLAYTVVSSRAATKQTVSSVSEVYLRELSDQVITHFNSGIESRFSQLDTLGTGLALYKPDGIPAAQRFLAAQQDNDDYAYLALRGSDGRFYTATDVISAQDVARELERGASSLEYRDEGARDIMLYQGTVGLEQGIEPIACGDIQFTGVIAGYDAALLSRQLNLNLMDGYSRSVMLDRQGTCVIGGQEDTLANGENLLTLLAERGQYEDGQDESSVRAELAYDEPFMLAAVVDGWTEYLYFTPIDKTDWYLCTVMPYGVVDSNIAALSGVLLQNAVVIGSALALVIGLFFLLYYRLVSRNTRLLAEEKARAEEASERATRASLAKSEFLSRMSHEIRTPMNGIMGMTALALEHLGDEERVRAYLGKVELSSRHLMTLINDILDMSKIESGKMEIRHEPFEFKTFVESLTTVFREQARQAGVRYETVLVGSRGTYFVGDALHLNQILYNLIGNAIKFTKPGGRVELRIEQLANDAETDVLDMETGSVAGGKAAREVGNQAEEATNATSEAQPVRLRFQVIHTGCGIPRDRLLRIFDSFEQGSSDVSRTYGGTGLGLSITKRFVELMGGRISVRSAVGKGSTFTVTIPVGQVASLPDCEQHAHEQLVPERRGDSSHYSFKGCRVLVAEDNEINLEIAVELMALAGACVDTAENGQAAVELFVASEVGMYDFILMDVQMPLMDGYEATRAIRALDRPDAHTIPIFAMTANAFSEDADRSRLSGMDGHISKPLDIRTVYATISKFLEDRAAASSDDADSAADA